VAAAAISLALAVTLGAADRSSMDKMGNDSRGTLTFWAKDYGNGYYLVEEIL